MLPIKRKNIYNIYIFTYKYTVLIKAKHHCWLFSFLVVTIQQNPPCAASAGRSDRHRNSRRATGMVFLLRKR